MPKRVTNRFTGALSSSLSQLETKAYKGKDYIPCLKELQTANHPIVLTVNTTVNIQYMIKGDKKINRKIAEGAVNL